MNRRGFLALCAAAGVLPASVSWAHPDNWKRSIANTLVHEGGTAYSNHRNDPGGPTKYGITIHDVRRYLDPNATASRVKRLTLDEALAIYRAHYWTKMRCDELPLGLDYSVFDYTVNAGPGRSGAHLREVLDLDGGWRVTDEVLAAVKDYGDNPGLIRALNDRRMRFQMGLGSRFNVFKRGWRRRILSVKAIALDMDGSVDKASLDTMYLIPRLGPGRAYLMED